MQQEVQDIDWANPRD